MKISKKIVEHYLASLLVASVAIWQTGNHHLKSVIWGAAVAVLGPVAVGDYSVAEAPRASRIYRISASLRYCSNTHGVLANRDIFEP